MASNAASNNPTNNPKIAPNNIPIAIMITKFHPLNLSDSTYKFAL